MHELPVALSSHSILLFLLFLFQLILTRCSLRMRSVPREITMSSELAMLNQRILLVVDGRARGHGVDHGRVDAPASLLSGGYVAPRLEGVQLVATFGCSLMFTTTRCSREEGTLLVAGGDTPRPLASDHQRRRSQVRCLLPLVVGA